MKSDILVIDPSIAGISGDMMLSSIVDIGADEKLVIENLESIKDYFKSCKKGKKKHCVLVCFGAHVQKHVKNICVFHVFFVYG